MGFPFMKRKMKGIQQSLIPKWYARKGVEPQLVQYKLYYILKTGINLEYTVLSELFVVGGSDRVYRRMRLCRVAQYNNKYLFGCGVWGIWGSSPRKF